MRTRGAANNEKARLVQAPPSNSLEGAAPRRRGRAGARPKGSTTYDVLSAAVRRYCRAERGPPDARAEARLLVFPQVRQPPRRLEFSFSTGYDPTHGTLRALLRGGARRSLSLLCGAAPSGSGVLGGGGAGLVRVA